MIGVVLVDDDPRVVSDFRDLLELEGDLRVLGIASNGKDALTLCDRIYPDVVVMDVRMPVMNGIDATNALRTTHHDKCRVLVITTFDLDDYVLGAIRAGARGFLLKDHAPDHLAAAIRTIAAGDAIVAPRATARLLAELVQPTDVAAGPLCVREREIVRLLAKGLSNDEIATAASISRSTVKTYVSAILTKLGLASRIQIVVWAYEQRLT